MRGLRQNGTEEEWVYIRRFYSNVSAWYDLWVWESDLLPGDERLIEDPFAKSAGHQPD